MTFTKITDWFFKYLIFIVFGIIILIVPVMLKAGCVEKRAGSEPVKQSILHPSYSVDDRTGLCYARYHTEITTVPCSNSVLQLTLED